MKKKSSTDIETLTVTTYRTKDGLIFDTREKAEAHVTELVVDEKLSVYTNAVVAEIRYDVTRDGDLMIIFKQPGPPPICASAAGDEYAYVTIHLGEMAL